MDGFIYNHLFQSACFNAFYIGSVSWILVQNLKEGDSTFSLWAIQVWCVTASFVFHSAIEINFSNQFCPLLS